MTTYVFIDANTALHFKRPDQLDWRTLTEATDVRLVAAPIFHRELELQKIHNQSRKLRERADAYIKWLVQFVRNRDLDVREGVRWIFLATEPQIDFAHHKLSTSVADDHLIASVLTFPSNEQDSVLLATADLGLEIKLRHRNIRPLTLPDEARLPREVDALEKEVVALRQQVANRHSPSLKLNFAEGGVHATLSIRNAGDVHWAALDSIREQHPKLHVAGQPPTFANPSIAKLFDVTSDFQSRFLSDDVKRRYNCELDKFYEEYSTYVVALHEWEQRRCLTVAVRLSLVNDGTAPATNIDASLHFPNDVQLFTKEDFPKRPSQPAAPPKPEIFALDIARNFKPSEISLGEIYRPRVDWNGTPRIADEGSEVNFSVRTLKHTFSYDFQPFVFCFPSVASVRSFEVEFQLSAAELPTRIEGRLNFVLQK